MLHKKIFKNLRLIMLVTLGVFLGITVGGVYYLNQTGLNNQWRDKIAQKLEYRGIFADFGGLRYDLSKGVVAKKVRIYSDSSRKETIATLENLTIDVDKTKLMRGKLRVNNILLGNAGISLSLDPDDPSGPRIVITELEGELHLPDKNTIAARNISGVVAGIKLTINAHIWSDNLGGTPKERTSDEKTERVNRIKVIGKIIQEISHWSWPQGQPPHLNLYAEGNLDNPDSSHLEFSLTAKMLSRDNVTLHDINIQGDYNNKVITLDRISMGDGAGKIMGRADFHPNSRKGRFEAKSTLHLQMLARKLFGVEPFPELIFSSPPRISCSGSMDFSLPDQPNIQLMGKARVSNFSYLGTHIENLQTEISIQKKNIFLTNLKASLPNGKLKARLLIKDKVIRYEVDSTLPPLSITPFIIQPIAQKQFKLAEFTDKTTAKIHSKGIIDLNDISKLTITGHCQFQNFSYKGVAMRSARADYKSTSSDLTFSDIKLVFDQTNYPLRKKYDGPTLGEVDSDQVVIDLKNKMVHIKNVRASAWPAPVVRLFHTPAADHCEQYKFRRPPNLIAHGSFDMNHSQARTDFNIDIRAPGTTYYDFLGEELTLKRLKGKVRIRQARVDVTQLAFQTFKGPCSGNITVDTLKKNYIGDLQWSRLHLRDLGATYGFDQAERGLITGRIDYKGHGHDIKTFNAKGSIGLERGNLFSIPMLGPLSPVIGKVLGKKNPTEEQAENASCTFLIRDGVVYSNNFLANTRSLRFTGEGNINLDTKKINILVRMNARGVFSILTLPLKPFMGLFQFQGSGHYSKAKWKSSMFTTPKRGLKDPIFRRPPKARIINE